MITPAGTPPRSPFAAKALRFILLGGGATFVVSALVNIVAAFQLIDAAEEQSLGFSRLEIVATYLGLLGVGVALIFLALRRRK